MITSLISKQYYEYEEIIIVDRGRTEEEKDFKWTN